MGYRVTRYQRELVARNQARARALAKQRAEQLEASSIKGRINREMSPGEARALRESLYDEIDRLLDERDVFIERLSPAAGDYALGRFDSAIFELRVDIARIGVNLATGFYHEPGVYR